MFNFLRSKESANDDPTTRISKDIEAVEKEVVEKVLEPPPLKKQDDKPHCHYTVGTDTNGDVVMKLHTFYGASTLTMNTATVRHLIRLLESAIVDEKADKTHD